MPARLSRPTLETLSMSRWKAALLHLIISAVIAVGVLVLMLGAYVQLRNDDRSHPLASLDHASSGQFPASVLTVLPSSILTSNMT